MSGATMSERQPVSEKIEDQKGFLEAVSCGAGPADLLRLCDEVVADYRNAFRHPEPGYSICNEALRRYAASFRRHKSDQVAAEYAKSPQIVTFDQTSGLFRSQAGDPVPNSGEFVVVPPTVGPAVIWDLWHLVSHVVVKDVAGHRLVGYLIPAVDRGLADELLGAPPK